MIREFSEPLFSAQFQEADPPRASTGISALDDILGGGFPRHRMYLVQGDPGAGKTTLALQFLLTGVQQGEPGVYVTLSETEEELRDVASSHGWSLDGITICDLQTAEKDSQYTLFHPSEVELSETTSLTHGVVTLEHLAPEYGGQRRRLRVQKIRGIRFRDGYHDFQIRSGGLEVFPRLVAAEHKEGFERGPVCSGVDGLDELVGGGLDRGTSTILLGPSGVGKSTLTMQYLWAAARRGEASTVYLFDETPATWLARAGGLGLEVRPHIESGMISLVQVDPAQLPPGEFAHDVRRRVGAGARMVVIDSLNGFRNAMPEERFLTLHLHELLSYLEQQGIVTLLVLAQYGLVSQALETPIDLSYLADTVLLLRYFEAFGEVRQAISVVKKRTGRHERSVRELQLGPDGVLVGRRLREFNGVLSGRPEYVGESAPLLGRSGYGDGDGSPA